MARNKIESSLALQNKVIKLAKEGLGSRAIASKILEDENIELSHMTVQRYLDSIKEKKGEILQQDTKLMAHVKESILDTSENLRKVNKILWEMIDDPAVSRNFKLKTIRQITNTVKVADELMNQFRGIKIDARGASKIQLVQVVIGQLNDMEERGDIKILNPKLRRDKEKIVEMEETEDGGYQPEEES